MEFFINEVIQKELV